MTLSDGDPNPHRESISTNGKHSIRLSSPSSEGPGFEPLVATLLTQEPAPRRLESPEDHNLDAVGQQENNRVNHTPKNRHKYNNLPTMEERLLRMPELRQLPWRPGVEAGAEQETGGDSRRKQIRFGCLLATRGEVVPVPCNSCANGRGKFQLCKLLSPPLRKSKMTNSKSKVSLSTDISRAPAPAAN